MDRPTNPPGGSHPPFISASRFSKLYAWIDSRISSQQSGPDPGRGKRSGGVTSSASTHLGDATSVKGITAADISLGWLFSIAFNTDLHLHTSNAVRCRPVESRSRCGR